MTVTIFRGIVQSATRAATEVTPEQPPPAAAPEREAAASAKPTATVAAARVSSEAVVQSVRTRTASQVERLRDPREARELADRIGREIVTRKAGGAHRLDIVDARGHLAR